MTPFLPASPDLSGLSEWAPELAQTFVSLASDVALILDDQGVIRTIAQGSSTPLSAAAQDWVGRPWAETVSIETRGKVEQLLKEVTSTGLARRREINHPSERGGNVALAYTAIRLGQHGPLLAVGRDLGAIAAIQQRFIEAQHELERGYWRARQAEARYRLLFQVATDAVLVADAQTLEILEANQAAAQLFDVPVEQMPGRPASFAFEQRSRLAIHELLAKARSNGQPVEIHARLVGRAAAAGVVATPFRSDDALRLLIRIRNLDVPGSSGDLNTTLARLVDSTSDGVVVTDSSGRILIANPSFLKLVQASTEAGVKGRPLMDWVGVSDEQFAVWLSRVRHQGISRRLRSKLLSADAQVSEVEISAALLTEGDQECIGFTIHFVRHAPQALDDIGEALRLGIHHIGTRVGEASLPELLRLSTALLERHFASLALARTNADPAAAARLLDIPITQLNALAGPPPEGS